MGDFFRFAGRHGGASFLGALGMILAALGYADQAKDVLTGFEPWQLQGTGAALFVSSVMMILYKWDKERIAPLAAPIGDMPKPQSAPPRVTSEPIISAPPRTSEIDGGRIVIDVTPEYLMAQCVGKTTVQAARANGIYIGKWMRITGELLQVADLLDGECYVGLKVPFTFQGTRRLTDVWLTFPTGIDRLEVMHVGDVVTALGRIEKISETTLNLTDCELV